MMCYSVMTQAYLEKRNSEFSQQESNHSCLATDGKDRNGLQREKIGQISKFLLCLLDSLLFLGEIISYYPPGALLASLVLEKTFFCHVFEQRLRVSTPLNKS